MDDIIKQEVKKKLEKEKERVIEELSKISKPDDGDHVPGDFQPNMPDFGSDTGDDPENSPGEVEAYEVNIDVTNKLQKLLNDIEEALDKLDNGEYGICDKCGKEISAERLSVNISALTCVKCE